MVFIFTIMCYSKTIIMLKFYLKFEPPHEKNPTKWHVRPTKTQVSLGIRPVWSESSLSTWRKLGSFATHWAHSEDSEIWVLAGRTLILLALSWSGSIYATAALAMLACVSKGKPLNINNERFSQEKKSKWLKLFLPKVCCLYWGDVS